MAKLDIVAEPGKHDITMSREFGAPRELLFKAYTDPELVAKWWGPRILTTTVDKMEVRPGGLWRFVHRDPQGNDYAFHGVYHDVTSPERIVTTFEFEGMPGHVLLESASFEELPGGRSKIVTLSVFQSVEDRDGMIQTGMESGAVESMDRLEELVASMK